MTIEVTLALMKKKRFSMSSDVTEEYFPNKKTSRTSVVGRHKFQKNPCKFWNLDDILL